ncbi:superfamily II DNA/RNA helicase [Chitinophaga skermanii]|uniref:Superfamily II DNA/RNA helicase n=1 Tax=Chitinophaga skermanii TaxID=331697 RepID=A0A327QLI8_9BACT|nr:DEAD/DEAH box helicase [Chitinophaga skermanii]RAJ05536.1 superfamily II DNA/RNA helicase [Chitinophaga skermanii]
MQQKNETIARILEAIGIDELNEMQKASIEANEQHDNVVLLSATGSGKTLAFLLPLLFRLDPAVKTTQAMIIVPSRELAIQIDKVFRSMQTGFKVTLCYGGHKREIEENNLVQAPALIIGTPGRIKDHIRRGNITLETINTLVLDEFDKSLELGFQEEVSFIVDALRNIQHRMLTSATEAVEIPEFLGLKDPAELNFLPADGTPTIRLEVKTVQSGDKDKLETLFELLCYFGARPSIIFCNHRESVERTSEYLAEQGIVNEYYHGAMEQHERDSALCKFRNGTVNFLVTTDLAARGLDIPFIRYIIHYHLPTTEDVYTHRNGRTARMEASGTAVLILGPEEKLPAYITQVDEEIQLPANLEIPEKPKWTTFYIAAGKKDKVNKIDIVGFLSQRGDLRKEDIGLIEVKDFASFVAIRKSKASHVLHAIKGHKIKNKKVKIEIAK